jgi:hypothetical protein
VVGVNARPVPGVPGWFTLRDGSWISEEDLHRLNGKAEPGVTTEVVEAIEAEVQTRIEREPEAEAESPVELGELLASLEAFVRRFVSFQSDHQAAAVALWVAHVYAIDAAHAAAYLRITSAVEESGKTTTLEVLELLLGRRGINAVSISPAAVFRTRDKIGPVALLLDEIDQTLKDRKDDGARDLLALVNAGYRRSAAVIRTVGQNHETRRFAAFGPAAIAGLGSMHPTTESRCIPIVLERKIRGKGERWIPFLVEHEARALEAELERWATEETIGRLRNARPDLPPELRDRHVEAWWGLFAIADAAGGEWPTRARTAAIVLHGERDAAATASLGVLLLDHVRQAFDDAGTDRLATADLLGRLVENEEGPWARWWGAEVVRDGPPRAAATDLARKLRPFEIRPKVIRLPEGTTPRGYHLEDFDQAFARYLPPPSGGDATGATPATPLARPVAPVASVAGGSGAEASDDELVEGPPLVDEPYFDALTIEAPPVELEPEQERPAEPPAEPGDPPPVGPDDEPPLSPDEIEHRFESAKEILGLREATA